MLRLISLTEGEAVLRGERLASAVNTRTPARAARAAVFVTVMGLSTLLHRERFNHGHPTFWAWSVLCLATPLVLPALYWWNRGHDDGTGAPGEVYIARPRRVALAGVGGAICLVAAALFFAPGRMIDIWSWQLTELAARVVSGWFGLAGVVGLSLSTDARWSAWRITLETQAIGIAFLLLSTVRAWDDLGHGSPMTWAFVGSLVAGLVAIVGSYVRVEGQRRDGARLRSASSVG